MLSTSVSTARTVGDLLREWRQRRRMSQLDLACEAEVSTRHLSFVETGRAVPSRDMVLHLAERLEVPLREQNALLVAAGYAPAFPERPLADTAMEAARTAIDLVLSGHEPYPALAIDRHWNLVAANRAVAPLLAGMDAEMRKPPVNVMRLSLHPKGLAPRIANLRQWRTHLVARLQHQIDVTADPVLMDLLREIESYPGAKRASNASEGELAGVIVPLQILTEFGKLSLFSTTTVFGTPRDITLSELALETFFPTDTESTAILYRLAERGGYSNYSQAQSDST